MDQEMVDALVEAATGDSYGVLITGSTDAGLHMIPNARLKHPSAHKEQTRLRWLLRTHDEQLTALLQKPVVLAVFWDSGDSTAGVNIIPESTIDPEKTFESFTLNFG